MKTKTNFDLYLKEQLKDPKFSLRLKRAGKDWDAALKLVSSRKTSGLLKKRVNK